MEIFARILICVTFFFKLNSACIEQLLDRPDASEYGYSVFNGPDTWGQKFKMCNGYRQSPVPLDMEDCHKMRFPKIQFLGHADERKGGFRIHNTFQSVEVQFSGDQPVLKGGPLSGNFTFSQMHFHWGSYGEAQGSEHQMKNLEHAMEAHLVHINSKYRNIQEAAEHWDGLAIIALLFTVNKSESEDLNPLVNQLRRIRHGDSYALLESSAMSWLGKSLDSDGKYLTYWGSLTTPPCNEVVTWIVLENTVEIGFRQLEHFRRLYGHEGKLEQNLRPIQPINNRYVFCPSEEPYEEQEEDLDDKKEDQDGSEEKDSGESSEEDEDDRKLAKPRPLWLPKKPQPYIPYSTYKIVTAG
ncbi:carbonic anhydrase 2-like [Neocloeon triangulifer]|uniref:carbonic anhydrase 2-like n=1 Tax=Neocloeon triangulifer TaxID=2078957 RepID=UPI00286F374C|nr:carbonic anhydrase 2-like [Neocloeon triangulifer]